MRLFVTILKDEPGDLFTIKKKILFPLEDSARIRVDVLKSRILELLGFQCDSRLFYRSSNSAEAEDYECLDSMDCSNLFRDHDQLILRYKTTRIEVSTTEDLKQVKRDSAMASSDVSDTSSDDSDDSSGSSSEESENSVERIEKAENSSSSSDTSSSTSTSSSESDSDQEPEEIPMIVEKAEAYQNILKDTLTNVSIRIEPHETFPEEARTVNDFIYPVVDFSNGPHDTLEYRYAIKDLVLAAQPKKRKRGRKSNEKVMKHLKFPNGFEDEYLHNKVKEEDVEIEEKTVNVLQNGITDEIYEEEKFEVGYFTVDVESSPDYSNNPIEGDLIIYKVFAQYVMVIVIIKVLELDMNLYIPRISDYKCATIESVETEGKEVKVTLKPKHAIIKGIQSNYQSDIFNPISSKPLPRQLYNDSVEAAAANEPELPESLVYKWSELQGIKLIKND